MDTTQTSYFILTALGGALGALILRSMLKLIGTLLTRCNPLAIYNCASPEPAKLGELRHTWGYQIRDSKSSNGYAWEYSSNYIERQGEQVTDEHTIYGPYLNDFGKPGFYRVRFRICGIGFPKTDEPIVSLDIVQSRFGTEKILRLLGQRLIKARDFSGRYQYFDIICHASGTGVYEYRCSVLPESVNSKDCKVRFDNIKIYLHPPIWEIL